MPDFDKVAGSLPAVVRPQDQFRLSALVFKAKEDEAGNTMLDRVELRLIANKAGDASVIDVGHNLVRKGAKALTFLTDFKAAPKAAITAWIIAGDTDA